jgi:hypothetical protein
LDCISFTISKNQTAYPQLEDLQSSGKKRMQIGK